MKLTAEQIASLKLTPEQVAGMEAIETPPAQPTDTTQLETLNRIDTENYLSNKTSLNKAGIEMVKSFGISTREGFEKWEKENISKFPQFNKDVDTSKIPGSSSGEVVFGTTQDLHQNKGTSTPTDVKQKVNQSGYFSQDFKELVIKK